MSNGFDIPDTFKNAPELIDGLLFYFLAYEELSSCRPASMGGLMPIPWTAINSWCEANGVEGEDKDDLFLYVRALDRDAIEKANKK